LSKSPCVRICRLNEEGWCIGCGMTIRDLRVWRNASEEEQEAIRVQSSERLRLQNMRDDDLLHD